MNILTKVKNDIIKDNLISKGDKVLIALSGGSDSVTLLHILSCLSGEIGFSLCCAHLNHNIRKESGEDENFCKKICKDMNIECFTRSVDIEKKAKQNKESVELCARKERYGFFEELKEKYHIDKIATAHNKNDSAESIMLHFIRGCGLDGLSGIKAKKDGYIIRPIINIEKKEILDYINQNNLEYVTDKTNFQTDYTRNKVRIELFPIIEGKINRGFVNTVVSNASVFEETAEFIKEYTDLVYDKICSEGIIAADMLLKESTIIQKNVILRLYSEFSRNSQKISNKYIEKIIDIVKSGNGKVINLPDRISAVFEYGKLSFQKTNNDRPFYSYNISVGETVFVPEFDCSITISEENEEKKSDFDKIYFYTDEPGSFIIRNRQQGDRFMPKGFDGTKSISDLFSDMKIPKAKRDLIPLLIYNNKIVWVMGIRADRRFLKGKKLLSCKFIKRSETNEKKQ